MQSRALYLSSVHTPIKQRLKNMRQFHVISSALLRWLFYKDFEGNTQQNVDTTYIPVRATDFQYQPCHLVNHRIRSLEARTYSEMVRPNLHSVLALENFRSISLSLPFFLASLRPLHAQSDHLVILLIPRLSKDNVLHVPFKGRSSR